MRKDRMKTKEYSAGSTVLTVAFVLICLVWIMPIYEVVVNSLKSNNAINLDVFALPNSESFVGFANYVKGMTFGNYPFLKSVGYSLFISVVSTALILLCCSMAAWYIARVQSGFAKFFYYLCLFSMIVPFQMVMFTLTSTADSLKLNTPWTIPVIYLGFGAGLAIFMFVGFVKSLPLEIEEAALKKDDDELTKARLAEVQKELAEQRDEFNQMKAKWESEKNAITKVNKLREEIERVNAEMERAERQYDLNKAAELKYGELPKLKKELAAEEAIAEKSKGEDSLLRDKVTEEEIARIVGRWTGIPVAKLMEGEREKLLHLEDTLHQRVIGQDEAVKRVSEAILRSRAGIQDPNRPLGSFLFLGPTGVGKTELAKALAQALFDDEKNMVRIDMSEYMEKFSVSRLIGAPPGYVGYDEGGQLTEAVRRHPYSVVLFDEVEKAHPDVFNVLLQVLDDGRITDSQGRTVDFKNTILIMTSNLGSEYILNGIANDDITPEARAQVDALLKTHFRPEFLNRIDEIVYYKPLTKEQISKIVLLMLDSLNKRLADRQLKVELTDAAMNAVIDQGFDPVYGARPLKRFIQSKIETLVAKHIIAADVKPGDTLTIDVNENGELYMRW